MLFRVFVLVLVASLEMTGICISQTHEAKPKLEILTKENQIGATIDMAYQIKGVVEAQYKDRTLLAYKRVSLRLSGCSLLYGMLAKIPSAVSTEQKLYDAAFQVYSITGSLLYPESIASYQQSMSSLKQEIINLRSDKQKMFYYLRNCKDLSESNSVALAIQELMLN